MKPFQTTAVQKIEEILINLSTGRDKQLQTDTINSIDAWKDAPFRPHVIARYRAARPCGRDLQCALQRRWRAYRQRK